MSASTDTDTEIVASHIRPDEPIADALTTIWSLFESSSDQLSDSRITLMLHIDGHQTDTGQPAEELDQFVTEFLIPIASGLCAEIHVDSPVDRSLDCTGVSLADTAHMETDRTDQLDDTGIEDGHTAAQFVTQNTPIAAYDPETESLAYAFLSTDTYTELIEHGDLTESQLLDRLLLDGQ